MRAGSEQILVSVEKSHHPSRRWAEPGQLLSFYPNLTVRRGTRRRGTCKQPPQATPPGRTSPVSIIFTLIELEFFPESFLF